jgi:phosphate binding protein
MSLNPMTSPNLSFAKSRCLGPAVFIGSLVVFAGCGGGDEEKSSTAAGTSTIEIGGSSTVYRISNVAREDYESINPKVHVIVKSNGTSAGFSQYLKNELDIIDASRAAKPEEEQKAKEQGIDWTRFLIGYDGIAVVVNKKNTFAKELSVADLKRLFGPDSKVKTWKDLNPAWPDKKIIIYTPDKESGTFDFFTEEVNGKRGAQRKDVQPTSSESATSVTPITQRTPMSCEPCRSRRKTTRPPSSQRPRRFSRRHTHLLPVLSTSTSRTSRYGGPRSVRL